MQAMRGQGKIVQYIGDEEILTPSIRKMANHLSFFNGMSLLFSPDYFFMDEKEGLVYHFHPKWSKGTRSEELDIVCETVVAFKSKIHSTDLNIVEKAVYTYNKKFIDQFAFKDKSNILFSHTFRKIKRNGDVCKVLHRYIYIPESHGNHSGIFGIEIDVDNILEGNGIVHTIEKIKGSADNLNYELMYKKVLHSDAGIDSGLINKRELEVAVLLSKGYISKQISGLLGISLHTVNIHRKNLLRKTRAKSTPEMLCAISNMGYI